MKDVLFIGCLYSDLQKDYFIAKSKRGYQFAAQNLQESLIEGFIANKVDLTVITIPSLSRYPFGYKDPLVKSCSYVYKNQLLGKSIGYNNIAFLRRLPLSLIKYNVDQWLKKTSNTKCVVVYGLHKWLMEAALMIKEMDQSIKLCVIVPDLPKFMGCNRFFKILGIQKRNIRKIYSMIPKFDSYVVLAESMLDDLNVREKPFVVIEGIFSDNVKEKNVKDLHKVILYTGNIGERYGILNLIKAFEFINSNDYQLWIRGNGSTKDFILKKSKEDQRIKYFAQMSKNELNKLQKTATILVNPVPASSEFTQYFFPSKTMDYLASGTPVLMYELSCLPVEYKEYLYFFDSEEPQSMAKTIVNICSLSPDELRNKGEVASKFILNQKNPRVQVKKIINLIESL
nr:glycosyltransferase [uncultured Bacteroides sp.]